MKATELTPHQRIEILEDVLKRFESGDVRCGLCVKIRNSAYRLFGLWDKAENIIPIFTLKNARKVTDVVNWAYDVGYWWNYFDNYDFENRIKFVKWMMEQERINILNL